MHLADQQYEEALVELGRALEETNWRPDVPLGWTLEKGGRSKLIALALLFYETHKPKLRAIFCDGDQLRPSIQVGADAATHLATHLTGLSWIEAAVVAPLANYLCHIGMSSLCKNAE
jgi:hypothetical protein